MRDRYAGEEVRRERGQEGEGREKKKEEKKIYEGR